jgi:hypothetical protein
MDPESSFFSKSIRKRPRFITMAVVIYLLFSIFGWLRFQQATDGATWLKALDISPPPPYIALTGISWGLVGLLAAIAIFMGWRSGPRLALGAAGFFVISYWIDFGLFNQSPVQIESLMVEIIASLSGLLAATFLPRLPGPRRFFDETSGD